MRNGLWVASRFAFLVVSITAAVAQVPLVPEGTRITAGQAWFPGGGSMSTAELSAAGSSFQPVTNRPYSADESVEDARTMADGMEKRETTEKAKLYRDSEGRTRAQVHIAARGAIGTTSPSEFVEIIDPVAGYHYLLDPGRKSVRRSTWPPDKSQQASGAAAQQATRRAAHARARSADNPVTISHVETANETLGTQYMEGYLVDGSLLTTRFLYGPAGNEQLVTTAYEYWACPELKIGVYAKTSDTRFGQTTVRLTNISQEEPDPSLFQVPEDYSMVAQ